MDAIQQWLGGRSVARAGALPSALHSEQRHNFEVAVLRRRKPTKAVVEAAATQARGASSVRRPCQIPFEPPADQSNWRLTGRINWPSSNQGYGVPICEWDNDKGTRIWLSAQLKELAVECTHSAPDRWGELVGRCRELATGARRRCGDHSLFVILCYLQLVAIVGN
jgi:hypothetical protein